MQGVKKLAIPGSLAPRWTKKRVARWLEVGAVPAIVGLWWPDWVGAYAAGTSWYVPPLLPAFPPIVIYVGAVALLVGCFQGVKGMGSHFRGVVVSGGLGVAAASSSIAAHLAGEPVAALALTGFAAVFVTAALWFTIGKVAEITEETRTRVTWIAIAAATPVAAGVYLAGVAAFAANSSAGVALMRAGIVVLTGVFALCRYGVHCYKTQTSIGASFGTNPDEQFWATAEG